MKIERTVNDLSVRRILDALANNLTPEENLRCKVLGPITTPVGADVEFTVNHNLGSVPTNYIWNVDQSAVIYDSRRVDWTDMQLFLKATAGSVVLYLIVV